MSYFWHWMVGDGVQTVAWFGEYCSWLNLIDLDKRWMADDQVPAHVIQINLVDIFQTFGSEEPMPKVLARIEFQVQDIFEMTKCQ